LSFAAFSDRQTRNEKGIDANCSAAELTGAALAAPPGAKNSWQIDNNGWSAHGTKTFRRDVRQQSRSFVLGDLGLSQSSRYEIKSTANS
jgi:hypothetical protein